MKKLTWVVAVAGLLAAGLCGTQAAEAAPDQTLCAASLPFGAPRLSHDETAVVCHAAYAAAVDPDYLIPRWVSYRLTADHAIGCFKRTDDFHPEESLSGRIADPRDYARSGYDRGHQAPADDFAWDSQAMHDSFSMANMAPQVPGLNRQEWEFLEEAVRAWAVARGELLVYVGPIVGPNPARIGRDGVAVPIGFWKIVIDMSSHEAMAFVMPQRNIEKGDLRPWMTSVSEVEKLSGVDLPLPPEVNADAVYGLWRASIAGYRKLHRQSCP